MEIATDHEGRQELLALLRQHGIDPTTVSVDGWNEDGYVRFRRAADGERTTRIDGGYVREFTPWPHPFPFEHFKKLAHQVTGVL